MGFWELFMLLKNTVMAEFDDVEVRSSFGLDFGKWVPFELNFCNIIWDE